MNKLSLTSAVFIGLAAMLGAGVFVVFGPAAELAGPWLLVSILLAGLVAYLNAASIAQLAAVVTRSGGAYAYGRQYLGKTWGFTAGASFLVGKIGSSAAIALTFAAYLMPDLAIPVAIGAVVVMAAINLAGINRTAFGSKILASITLLFLTTVILSASFAPARALPERSFEPIGVLSAAALFFFAFAGYARVATLGGEVADSAKNVPKAIRISLGTVLLVYLTLGFLLITRLGNDLGGVTPLADLADYSMNLSQWSAAPFAAVAALGSLLALLAGMSRTAAEMASDRELPKAFAGKLRNGAPVVAEVTISLLVILLIISGSILLSIALSSFAILSYYAIANLAAYRQPAEESSRRKVWNLLGLLLCVLLALSVPPSGLLLGVSLISVMLFLRWGLKVLR